MFTRYLSACALSFDIENGTHMQMQEKKVARKIAHEVGLVVWRERFSGCSKKRANDDTSTVEHLLRSLKRFLHFFSSFMKNLRM